MHVIFTTMKLVLMFRLDPGQPGIILGFLIDANGVVFSVLIMVSRISFDVVRLHCSYMQILHQPAMSMVYAMRHASCALLLPKLILLRSKKQPGHSLILQGTKLSSLQCCPSSQQDATDLWSSPPKTPPHQSHLPPPVSSLPQACVSPLACFTQQHESQWHCHGDTILAGCTTWVYHVQHTL